jgi:hypothetical protein
MLKTWVLRNRPYAVFDANNKEHRHAYSEFLRTSSWHSCPYQFVLEEPYTDLVANITHKLVAFYTQEEFLSKNKSTKKKTSK